MCTEQLMKSSVIVDVSQSCGAPRKPALYGNFQGVEEQHCFSLDRISLCSPKTSVTAPAAASHMLES